MPGKTVLELNAGTGIGGIAIKKWTNAKAVSMCDYREELLYNMRKNCERNEVKDIVIFKYNWEEIDQFIHKYDLIVCADILKAGWSYQLIYKVFKQYLHKGGRAVIIMPERKEELRAFMEIVAKEIGQFEVSSEVLTKPEYDQSPLLNKVEGEEEFPRIGRMNFCALNLIKIGEQWVPPPVVKQQTKDKIKPQTKSQQKEQIKATKKVEKVQTKEQPCTVVPKVEEPCNVIPRQSKLNKELFKAHEHKVAKKQKEQKKEQAPIIQEVATVFPMEDRGRLASTLKDILALAHTIEPKGEQKVEIQQEKVIPPPQTNIQPKIIEKEQVKPNVKEEQKPVPQVQTTSQQVQSPQETKIQPQNQAISQKPAQNSIQTEIPSSVKQEEPAKQQQKQQNLKIEQPSASQQKKQSTEQAAHQQIKVQPAKLTIEKIKETIITPQAQEVKEIVKNYEHIIEKEEEKASKERQMKEQLQHETQAVTVNQDDQQNQQAQKGEPTNENQQKKNKKKKNKKGKN